MKNKLTAVVLALLLVITAFPVYLISAEYEGGFSYEVAEDQATVTGYDGTATAVTVPDTLGGYPVVAIGSQVFKGSLVQSVSLPQSLLTVYADSFPSTSIRSISVSGDNEVFSSANGVLYDKAGTTLVRYPAGKTDTNFKIPTGTTAISPYAFKDVVATLTVGMAQTITDIGDSAFENATNLNIDTLPTSLVNIGNGAFKGAGKLTLNTFPASLRTIGNNAFEDCTSLSTFTIYEGLQSIGSEAFKGCTAIRFFSLPASLTSIGQDAFLNNPALTSFYINSENPAFSVLDGILYSKDATTLVKYPDNKTSATFNMPETVIAVANNAFAFAQNLRTVNTGANYTAITAGAFRDCTSVEQINLTAVVSSIDVTSFDGCTSLRRILVESLNPQFASDGQGVLYNKTYTELLKIPQGYPSTIYNTLGTVLKVGNYASNNCRMLTQINLPSEVTDIGFGAFMDCKNLAFFAMPNKTVNVADSAFEGCTALATVAFDDPSLETIGARSFYGCTALNDFTAPSTLKSIGVSAFENSGLNNVAFNDTLETISSSAFARTAITTADIPASVTTIGDRAFFGCANLEEINVDENNENYLSDDGVLYSTAGRLMQYPMAKASEKYVVLKSTVEIGTLAFYSADGLKSVKIYKGVTAISNDAFNGIRNTVQIIGYLDSTADAYATANNIDFLALDANPTDLMLTSVGPEQTGIVEGDDITFTCTVRNIGDYATTENLTVDFYVNGRLLESVKVAPIAANRAVIVRTSETYTTVFGNCTVTAMINIDEEVPETDFTNNRMKKRFTIE